MGYYKKIDKVMLEGDRYSAKGTPGEVRKRGVDSERCIEVDNSVEEIRLVRFYNTSGEVEYGLAVVLECVFENGDIVRTTMDGVDYLTLVKKYSSDKGTIRGDFLFLFQGVLERLVERRGEEHISFLNKYEQQEDEKLKAKNFKLNVGDITDVHNRTVYLGEYFYLKPNFKNDNYLNKPRKYKLYLRIDEEGNYLDNELYVESGKTQYNQPTEKKGHIEVDFATLKEIALERMETMFKKDTGYREGYLGYRPQESQNNKAYVLTNIANTKEELVEPTAEDLLKRAWLCGWDDTMPRGKFEREDRRRLPYKYVEKE